MNNPQSTASSFWGLYFILNYPCENPFQLAQAAIEGGIQTLQLRAKNTSSLEFYEIAHSIASLARKQNVRLIINDRLDIAIAVKADGVHLGKEDLPIQVVKKIAPQLLVGISCYGNIQKAKEAEKQGADYVAFGAMFSSPTKQNAPTISIDVLNQAKRELRIPIVAIGGITLQKVPILLETGIDGIAVISAIQEEKDPQKAAAAFKETMQFFQTQCPKNL